MLFILILCLLAFSKANLLNNILEWNIPEDGRLNFIQIAKKYGQECEEFYVATEDGYILTVFHIKGNEGKPPVLMMHGCMDSADTFIIRGNISIAISLAEAGYDVWAGNVRGSKYSNHHVKFSPTANKMEFWDYSFHEMGVYDLPATIDFILKKTGKQSLSAIGHSQGNTIFYVLGSERPKYNEKVSVFIALAPIAYLNDISDMFAVLIEAFPIINELLLSLGKEGLMQDYSTTNELIKFLCSQGALGSRICAEGMIGSLMGHDPDELEPEFVKVAFGHYPSGTSRKTLAHFYQISKSVHFAPYNYGVTKNMYVYKCACPPAYNLSNVKMPVVLVAAENDGFSGLKDVERLRSQLPNVVMYHVMEQKKWNHVDYVWGKHSDLYMTPILKNILHKFT